MSKIKQVLDPHNLLSLLSMIIGISIAAVSFSETINPVSNQRFHAFIVLISVPATFILLSLIIQQEKVKYN